MNGMSTGILESISKFTNAFTSPVLNENDNEEEEEDELNVKEPISTNSSPMLTEPFSTGSSKSVPSFEPNYSSPFFSADLTSSIIEDRPLHDHARKELEATLSHLVRTVEKIQRDISMIHRILSMSPWHTRLCNMLKRSWNHLFVKVGGIQHHLNVFQILTGGCGTYLIWHLLKHAILSMQRRSGGISST